MSEKICEICKNPIEENDETEICPDCGLEFHQKCRRMTGCCVNADCRQKANERKEAERKKKIEAITEKKAKAEVSENEHDDCSEELNEKSETGFADESWDEEEKPRNRKKLIKGAVICAAVIAVIVYIVVARPFIEPCEIHSYETIKILKEATCTEKGLEKQKCSVCGEKREYETPTVSHDWSKKVIKEAACTKDGEKECVCKVCGERTTEKIKCGHKWVPATCTHPRKCSECGKKSGKKLDHSYYGGICTFCGAKISVMYYRGVQFPQMPYTESGLTFWSVKGMTSEKDLQIKIVNRTAITYDKVRIGYKIFGENTAPYSSSVNILDFGTGETKSFKIPSTSFKFRIAKIQLWIIEVSYDDIGH